MRSVSCAARAWESLTWSSLIAEVVEEREASSSPRVDASFSTALFVLVYSFWRFPSVTESAESLALWSASSLSSKKLPAGEGGTMAARALGQKGG